MESNILEGAENATAISIFPHRLDTYPVLHQHSLVQVWSSIPFYIPRRFQTILFSFWKPSRSFTSTPSRLSTLPLRLASTTLISSIRQRHKQTEQPPVCMRLPSTIVTLWFPVPLIDNSTTRLHASFDSSYCTIARTVLKGRSLFNHHPNYCLSGQLTLTTSPSHLLPSPFFHLRRFELLHIVCLMQIHHLSRPLSTSTRSQPILVLSVDAQICERPLISTCHIYHRQEPIITVNA